MGTGIDVPLGHKDDAWTSSHFDAMEIRVPDAPRANEVVVAVVVTELGPPQSARYGPAGGTDVTPGRTLGPFRQPQQPGDAAAVVRGADMRCADVRHR